MSEGTKYMIEVVLTELILFIPRLLLFIGRKVFQLFTSV